MGSCRRRLEHRELVGNLELAGAEAVERRGAAARAARLSPAAGRLQEAAANEDALEVRRRDLVAERGGVDVAELREREVGRREREARVRVGQLGAQPLAAGEH